jgi:hypothetical protein
MCLHVGLEKHTSLGRVAMSDAAAGLVFKVQSHQRGLDPVGMASPALHSRWVHEPNGSYTNAGGRTLSTARVMQEQILQGRSGRESPVRWELA